MAVPPIDFSKVFENFSMLLAFCHKNLPNLLCPSGLTADQVEQSIKTKLGAAESYVGASLADGGALFVSLATLFSLNPLVEAACNANHRETVGIWLEEHVFRCTNTPDAVAILLDATSLVVNIWQAKFQKFVDVVWAAIENTDGGLSISRSPVWPAQLYLAQTCYLFGVGVFSSNLSETRT